MYLIKMFCILGVKKYVSSGISNFVIIYGAEEGGDVSRLKSVYLHLDLSLYPIYQVWYQRAGGGFRQGEEPHGARDERGRGAAGQLVLGLYCCINRWRSAVTVKTSCPRGMPLTSPARHSRRNRPHYRLRFDSSSATVLKGNSTVLEFWVKLLIRCCRPEFPTHSRIKTMKN